MKFTIRDLFLVTVIVASVLGWWIDHRRMSLAMADAKVWRTCAGALEYVLVDLGWMVQWEDSETVDVRRKDGNLPIHFDQ
jgi:hypothetical protein